MAKRLGAEREYKRSLEVKMKTVAVFSGGLDSTTLVYHLLDANHEVKALTVDYGQRHSREIEAARRICEVVGIQQHVVDLSGLAACFGHNALTDDSIGVPHGEYQEATMQDTTVPNRNMILLSVAIGWAVAIKFDSVAFGAHTGEYTPYPDCRPEFASAMNDAARVCDWDPIEVLSPFVEWNKAGIVRRGTELDVPFELTWSCYEGGKLHCGKCSTCLDRKQAFSKCSLVDPVAYSG